MQFPYQEAAPGIFRPIISIRLHLWTRTKDMTRQSQGSGLHVMGQRAKPPSRKNRTVSLLTANPTIC